MSRRERGTRGRRRPRAPAAGQPSLARVMELHKEGHLEAALDGYRRLLAKAPEDADVLHYLGVCEHQCGRGEAALAHIRQALGLAPGYVDAHNNLGNVLLERGEAVGAEQAYRQVIALRPGHAPAHSNLGVALRGQGRYDEAVAAYRQALDLAPRYVAAWQNLGNVLSLAGQLDAAVIAYLRALEIAPHDTTAYDALGKALYRVGRVDEAVAVYRQWLEREPGSPVARHMLAACSGEDAPERAGDAYVSRVFDDFAASFDQVLERLEYAAPGLVAAAVDAWLPGAQGLDVLDAGCGTGLCGSFLAPRARRLVGVDLSRAMLAKAAGRRCYHRLEHGELTAFMRGCRDAFDLVVSADTLVYFGALDAVLAAARGALRAGGTLIFTVERAGEDGASGGYRLTPSGRYAHGRGYVSACLQGAGLAACSIADAQLRHEGGWPVAGLVVVARATD